MLFIRIIYLLLFYNYLYFITNICYLLKHIHDLYDKIWRSSYFWRKNNAKLTKTDWYQLFFWFYSKVEPIFFFWNLMKLINKSQASFKCHPIMFPFSQKIKSHLWLIKENKRENEIKTFGIMLWKSFKLNAGFSSSRKIESSKDRKK